MIEMANAINEPSIEEGSASNTNPQQRITSNSNDEVVLRILRLGANAPGVNGEGDIQHTDRSSIAYQMFIPHQGRAQQEAQLPQINSASAAHMRGEGHFKMNRAFKVIQGHPYFCR